MHSPSDEEYFTLKSHIRFSFLLLHLLYKNLSEGKFSVTLSKQMLLTLPVIYDLVLIQEQNMEQT